MAATRARIRTMQGLLVAGVTAGLIVASFLLAREMDETPEVTHETLPASGALPGAPPADGKALREQLLHATAQQIGVTPVRGVWGVLMERGYTKGVATVVALADGTASMYLSTGGSAVGGKSYEPAHAAAVKLCEQAADSFGDTIPAHEFPSPVKGRVRFYVLSEGGVRTAELDALAGAADAGGDALGPLGPLLAAGDAVLDGLKEATSKGLIR
jgi:hypothetical protein